MAGRGLGPCSELAAGVFPWLCWGGVACTSSRGTSVTGNRAARCPVTLAMLLEKCGEETGWRGDLQQINCSVGGRCGWWERWGKALPMPSQLPLAGTKLPWPKWDGGHGGRYGAWWDLGKPGGTTLHLMFAHVRGVRNDVGWWEGVLFGLRICGKRLGNML